MGPLIPQGVIDGGWSFVIALLVGVCFGFILEASGLFLFQKNRGLILRI
jgi:hypothetical protein